MSKLKNINNILFFVCLFAVGLFNEYLACIASALLLLRLGFVAVKSGRFSFKLNFVTLTIFAVSFFYLLSSLWAVDSGMAVVGFFKFLPALIFLLILQQQGQTQHIFELLPLSAVFMTVLSAVLSFIPVIKEYFTVAGRLSGFFQYSNTYAVFVLLSLILLISKGLKVWYEWIFAAVLLFGILYSGSRTVFLIMLIALPLAVLCTKSKKLIVEFFCLLALSVAGAALYVAISGNFDTVGRFLTVSLKESTLLGRLLYYKDALPVILKHPFGLGYMGYYYFQQSFQTGVYSVMFVHNDFLQLALDIGWVPTALLIFTVIRAFFKKGTAAHKRIMLLTLSLHCLLEFNLAFIAMWMLLILILDYDSGRAVSSKAASPVAVTAVLLIASLYFGAVELLTYLKKDEIALKLYPLNTVSQIRLLTKADVGEELLDTALDITDRNEYVSVAYSAAARYYYSKGDFENVINYKHLAFEKAPYQTEEYREYCYMLIVGIRLYENAKDTASADFCRMELLSVPDMLERVKENTSDIAFDIKDKPDFTLGDEIISYISKASEGGV